MESQVHQEDKFQESMVVQETVSIVNLHTQVHLPNLIKLQTLYIEMFEISQIYIITSLKQ